MTGYDPECCVKLVERIWPQVSSGISPVFSTSPPLPEPLIAMRKEIASILPKRDNAVVSTPEFSQFQERVRAWSRPTVESGGNSHGRAALQARLLAARMQDFPSWAC